MKENNGERIQIPVPHDKPKDARLETDTAVSHLIRKRRIYACIAIAVILLGVGVLHLINPVEHTIIPCLFYELTGIPCFGCGTTRCLYFLSRFDFASAFRYNAYLTALSPLLLYWSGAELLNALARAHTPARVPQEMEFRHSAADRPDPVRHSPAGSFRPCASGCCKPLINPIPPPKHITIYPGIKPSPT